MKFSSSYPSSSYRIFPSNSGKNRIVKLGHHAPIVM